jgi:cholesterol oxidase
MGEEVGQRSQSALNGVAESGTVGSCGATPREVLTLQAHEHFDAVVIGSGFGGSVTAYRLAEAGRSVCLLERGKPYPPGSFPRSPHGLSRNFWNPSEGLLGMFDVWSFSGLDALISSGLGGGSLIYANVMIRKDEHWFVHDDGAPGHEYWPVTRADLEPHYDRAERMLHVQRYPFEHEPYASTHKTRALKDAAERLGRDWFLPNLAVTFANEGSEPVPGEPIREEHPNLHGRTRYTCRLVGECDVGCNYGSKNSLDYTYLSEAKRLGAELRTLCEVRTFRRRDGGGFEIDYVVHDPETEGHKTNTHALPLVTVTADRLIVSAGTLGSTFLLLRNRDSLRGLSPVLGTHFCGNGDLLTFAVRCSDRRNGHAQPAVIDPNFGPVITSAIRYGDSLDGDGVDGRGFYVEDAGYPDFISWMLEGLDEPRALWAWRKVGWRLVRKYIQHKPETNISDAVSAVFGDSRLSAGILPLLGMGRDIPDGRMHLVDGKLEVDWTKNRASKPYFERVRKSMEELATELGGEFQDNPLWWLSRVITVHALGGCPMGRNADEGVVDAWGRAFGVPGLHVADGSVMPGPVGPNPSLTIAALADRFADAIIEGRPEP